MQTKLTYPTPTKEKLVFPFFLFSIPQKKSEKNIKKEKWKECKSLLLNAAILSLFVESFEPN